MTTELAAEFWLSEYLTPWDTYAHGVKDVLLHQHTQFQEVWIIETGFGDKALILDGKWQSCTADEFIYHETLVHPAIALAHRHLAAINQTPRSVLVLGGAEGATIREVLRWRTIEQVVMVDIDGELVSACQQYLPEMHQNSFDDPRVQVVIEDALQFLDRTPQQWDVIVSDLTDPIESGPAYPLFTLEHYQQIRHALAPTGVFALQAGSLILSELPIHACLSRTVRSVFPHVHTCSCFAPSYGFPLAFLLASPLPFDTQPDPVESDRLFAQHLTSNLRLIDGMGLLGALQMPLYLREAIAAETQIYTMVQPPKIMGRGQKQND
jgi:spermidine synthase